MAVSERLASVFASQRAHQMATYRNSGLSIDGKDARQFTGGGACYGYHAMAAFQAARSWLYFLEKWGKRK